MGQRNNIYSSLLTITIVLIILCVSMVSANELIIKNTSDKYKPGETINFTITSENEKLFKNLSDWNIDLSVDNSYNLNIPILIGDSNIGKATIKEITPTNIGYGYNGQLSETQTKKEYLVTIDSSIMKQGENKITLKMDKKNASESHSISTLIIVE